MPKTALFFSTLTLNETPQQSPPGGVVVYVRNYHRLVSPELKNVIPRRGGTESRETHSTRRVDRDLDDLVL